MAKTQEPKQHYFSINEIVALVVDLMKKDLEGIELIRDFKPDIPELLADPGMMEHALVNLVQNTIHAMGRNQYKRLIVRTFHLDDFICFSIEDNGCGMLEKHRTAIYYPSFTLKGSRDKAGSYPIDIKGTGYGMSNVKKYIDQHNGKIEIQSEFGKGTTFIIRLPIIKKELTAREKSALSQAEPLTGHQILIVEDEQAISDVQYRILTQLPMEFRIWEKNNMETSCACKNYQKVRTTRYSAHRRLEV